MNPKYRKTTGGNYVLKDARERRRIINERAAVVIRQAKARPCIDCGVEYPYWIMQFDHVRGIKEFALNACTGGCIGIEPIKTEIAKCDVVCANCHADRTYQRIKGVGMFQVSERSK